VPALHGEVAPEEVYFRETQQRDYCVHPWHEFVSIDEKATHHQAQIYSEEIYPGAQVCSNTFVLEFQQQSEVQPVNE
jgi:hypothetical protein